jgi:Ca-activated chloride channel family protein
LATILLALAAVAAPVLAAERGSDLVVILDASNSMWGQVEGEHKIVIARRVLAEVLGKMPETASIGLIAYGHRREGDCDDIQAVVPIGEGSRDELVKKIESLNPRGKTPITKSLNLVFEEIDERDRPATIVLVSDGIETCKGDPCAAVRDAKAKGIPFVLHVIGFDVGDVDISQLQCTARAGDGLYLSADDAGQFAGALAAAVATVGGSPSR